MKKFKLIFFGREGCRFCPKYKKVLQEYWSDEIDEFKECTNYSEAVPRLSAIDLGGNLIATRTGVLNDIELEELIDEATKKTNS